MSPPSEPIVLQSDLRYRLAEEKNENDAADEKNNFLILVHDKGFPFP